MPPARRLAAVTCAEMPDLDAEWAVLRGVLDNDGWETSIQVWDDPGVAWENFDVVLVRVAAWGYIHRPEKFLDWAGTVERFTTLVNPARVLRWNHDKVYLPELATAGLPIVETAFVRVGDSWSWPEGEFREADPSRRRRRDGPLRRGRP